MKRLTFDLVALFAAGLLAAGTAYGIVASQQNSNTKVSSTPVSYGQ